MSFAATMVNSSQSRPPPNVILRILPRGHVLRTVTPCSIPGNRRSSTYRARPVTFSRPSLRGTDRPMQAPSMRFLLPSASHPSYCAPHQNGSFHRLPLGSVSCRHLRVAATISPSWRDRNPPAAVLQTRPIEPDWRIRGTSGQVHYVQAVGYASPLGSQLERA